MFLSHYRRMKARSLPFCYLTWISQLKAIQALVFWAEKTQFYTGWVFFLSFFSIQPAFVRNNTSWFGRSGRHHMIKLMQVLNHYLHRFLTCMRIFVFIHEGTEGSVEILIFSFSLPSFFEQISTFIQILWGNLHSFHYRKYQQIRCNYTIDSHMFVYLESNWSN